MSIRIEQIELVPHLEPRRVLVDADLRQDGLDVGALRLRVGMSNVTDVNQQIRGHDLLERSLERRNQLGRQVRDETHRIRQDRLVDAGKLDLAQCGIERCEKQVFCHHVCASQPVEQSRLSGICVTDKRDDGPRRALAAFAVKPTSTAHLLELALEPRHSVADQAAIGFDLCFARTTEEAETTTLPFKVRPASDEATCLIIEMGKFHLQSPFGGRGSLAKDLEDQAGTVDDLCLQRLFKVALLNRTEARIEHDKARLLHANLCREQFDLPATDQSRWFGLADAVRDPFDDLDTDRRGQTGSLLQACVDIAGRVALVRKNDDCTCATRKFVPVAFEAVTQSSVSVSSVSVGSSARFSGRAGWIVETACL